jgi:hypothetical protein
MKLLMKNFIQPPVTSSLLLVGPNIPLSILLSNILNLISSLDVRDQFSHPYKTTGRISVMYILIFTWSHSRRKTKDYELRGRKHSQNLVRSNLFLIYIPVSLG